jgi:hypothetical protein
MFLPVIAAGIPLLAAGAAAAVGGAALLGGAIAGGVALHKHFSTPPPPPPSMKSCDQLPAEKVCKKMFIFCCFLTLLLSHRFPPPVQEEVQVW